MDPIWSQKLEDCKIKVVLKLVAYIEVLNAGGHLLHEVVVDRLLVVGVGQVVHIAKSLKLVDTRVTEVLLGHLAILHGLQLYSSSFADSPEYDRKYVGVEYEWEQEREEGVQCFRWVQRSEVPVGNSRESDRCVVEGVSVLAQLRQVDDVVVGVGTVDPEHVGRVPVELDEPHIKEEKEGAHHVDD